MRRSHWVISLKIGSFEESFFKVSPFPFSWCSQIKMSSRSLKCKDDWRAVAKISMPETQLANFRQIKKKKKSCVFWQVYVLRFWPPHHYENAAVSLISICVQTLQPIFTSNREKKLSSATMFLFGFFFSLTSRRWHVDACHRGTVLGNRSIYMTSKRTFEHLLFCARWGEEQKVASFLFLFFEGKTFWIPRNLFSLLRSFAPFSHSRFPYSSPNFRLISAVNIHEACCGDQGAGGRRNMKGFLETNYSASLTQNVPPAFLYCWDQFYHGEMFPLSTSIKCTFKALLPFFSCSWKVNNALVWGAKNPNPRPHPNPSNTLSPTQFYPQPENHI